MRERIIKLGTIALALLFTAACQTQAPASPTASAKTTAAAPASTPAAKAPASSPVASKPAAVPSPAAAAPASASPASKGASVAKQWSSPPPMSIDTNKTYTAVIDTNLGQMKAELFVKDAPNTVNNFVFLAREGFYDGVIFHRIIKGFMIQTGDPRGDGTGGPGYRFNDELPKGKAYTRGIIAMANAGPNTQGSQFFIMDATYQLPPNYTIFGQVIAGDDVLEKLSSTPVTRSPRGEPSVPTQKVQMDKVTIEEK